MTTIDPDDAPRRDQPPRSSAEEVLEEAAAVVEPLEHQVEMAPLDKDHRLLLVHAHPDDETVGTGATMAKYAADGALVTLVTCTLGEEGEVLVPELEHLSADRDDTLGRHRIGELAAAMQALGVADHRFLGGPGRYRDSGMMGLPTNDRADAFWRADLEEAAGLLVAVIREVRPQVVVTYDENGGYGHPDHIQAHRVTMAAVERSGDPGFAREVGEPWQVPKVYWTAIPRSYLQAGIDEFKEQGLAFFEGVESADELPFALPDELVTTQVDARTYLDAKLAAMRAHATQIAAGGPFFALSDNVGQRAFGLEHFRLVRGERGPGNGPNGWEDDLFAGVNP
jgi:N-acetyl-1-D-myo-inositol-2-amino-2-deoxy-alpha-D-glucopyranoside deacetylase